MEWLGILLLYAISAYMKKRNKDAKQREIESDPEWDPPEDYQPPKQPQSLKPNLDQLLNDLFQGAVKLEPDIPEMDEIEDDVSLEEISIEEKPYQAPVHVEDHSSHIEDQAEAFKQNVHHSKLADRKEMRLGKKWKKKNKLRSELFDSNKSLKKAIILKEVLDKPLALR
jgi:hypothetical protein